MGQKKNWILKITAGFFAVMTVMTIVSRAVYQHSIVAVTTERAGPDSVSHTVLASGNVIGNQDLAVSTVGGLRIAGVQVNEGQQVKNGDLLFNLDLDYLEEMILLQQQNMKKQKLSNQEAWSAANASQQQRENQKEQAQENYNSAVSRAQVLYDRAERDLQRSKKALEDFYNGIEGSMEEEQRLIAACEEAQISVETARDDLQALRSEMDSEIQMRLQEAEQEIPPASSEPTIPETIEPEETIPEETSDSAPETTENSIPETSEAVVIETTTAAENTEVSAPVDETVSPEENATICIPSRPSAMPRTSFRELTPGEIEEIKAAVYSEYAGRIAEAEDKIRDSEFALKLAQEELAQYQENQKTEKTEAELIADIESAQEVFDDAAAALENAKINGNRGIESAGLPNPVSNAGAIGQITYDQMEQHLEKLQEIREAEGKVFSPVDGIITELHIKTGELTSDRAAILMVDLSKGCKFNCQVTEEDYKYIGVGDLITLTTSNGSKTYKDIAVTSIREAKDEEGVYHLSAELPANTLRYGSRAELSFTKKSRAYDICIPLSALHMDARNVPYVLVPAETESILGKEMEARKISVKILEQNNSVAALDPGSIAVGAQVIISAEGFLDVGTRIRVQ